MGDPIRATIFVLIQPYARDQIHAFLDSLVRAAGRVDAFLIGGTSDLLNRVAAPSRRRPFASPARRVAAESAERTRPSRTGATGRIPIS